MKSVATGEKREEIPRYKKRNHLRLGFSYLPHYYGQCYYKYVDTWRLVLLLKIKINIWVDLGDFDIPRRTVFQVCFSHRFVACSLFFFQVFCTTILCFFKLGFLHDIASLVSVRDFQIKTEANFIFDLLIGPLGFRFPSAEKCLQDFLRVIKM